MTRGKIVRAIVYPFLFLASLSCFGIALFSFFKTEQTHRLLLENLLPQYQYALEMERTAQKGQRNQFFEARSQFLEGMEPDQDPDWVEAVSMVPMDLAFVQNQILPHMTQRLNQLQNQQKGFLAVVWIGFLAAILFSLVGFAGLGVAYYTTQEREDQWDEVYQAILPPAHRLSMTLKELGRDSQRLQEQVLQNAQQSAQVIEGTDQLQAPVNQIEGVAGLVHDATESAARQATETAERLKQVQEKLFSSQTMMSHLTERTERMRVLAEGLSDLADQANLFLVNSSIEMARQGEKGRGFQAVAQEVSTLADGSVKTSQELIGLIRQVNEEAARQAASLQQEVGSFAATYQTVAKTDQSFADLSRMVQHLCDQANSIAKKFQYLFLQTRSLKETTGEFAQVQQKWQQWLTASQEAIGQITDLLQDKPA